MTDAGKRFAVIGNAYLRESFRQQGYNVDALVAAIEAEAVVAERQRIKAAVERLSLLDAPGMWVEFDAVIAIIDGESDDA